MESKVDKSKFWKHAAKKYGVGVAEQAKPLRKISSGSPLIDHALGGGFPLGRIVEIYGKESSGKTSLCLSTARQAQAEGLEILFIDLEHALSTEMVDNLGLSAEHLTIIRPDTAEQALDVLVDSIEAGVVDLAIVDSTAALSTEAEIANGVGAQRIGEAARLMNRALRKIVPAASKHDALVMFINQLRDKIGTNGYGGGETTPGGNGLKFYSSIRVRLARVKSLKQGEEPIGIRQQLRVQKNKVASPHRKAETTFLFSGGYNPDLELFDAAVAAGIVYRRGAWYYLEKGEKEMSLGQGSDKALAKIQEDPKLFEWLKKELKG